MFRFLYAVITGSVGPHVPVSTPSYLPSIWILIEIVCRNYRGVGPYWRGKHPTANLPIYTINKGL